MSSPQNREEALFQAASQLAGAERVTFLNGACLGDDALRQRLDALFAAHDAPDELSPKHKPAAKGTIKLEIADAPDEAVGQTLGRYKLLERVGEGGCGVVYVAEQTEPVRRRVALKVIKLGMDTKQVVARFEAERQALAMMDHPNIAKVLDAGTTELGRPYFVMELVRGIRITDYCDQNHLSTKERLDLFIKVCHAIQHAHQKGIIHRDIKPSNILVTLHDGVPVPKVIDFGIAKATEGRLTDATVYTQLHQFIGTPAYMSPEQAEMSGLDIDTRSDIYSLGVLLYELLAGSTPFDGQELMSRGIDAMRKTIREQEPVRPSTRFATLKGEDLTTTAKRRSADKAKLMHQLKGDLDWIVMKCLEKDRTRRYDTANGLAFDLKRHLNNEPVLARPPSTAYKFQKAFRRNKVVFTAGVAVAFALLIGIIVSTWQSVRATHAKREALAAKALALEAQTSESVQRQKAEANEQKAVAAQTAEAAEELKARQRAYASDMNVAGQALADNNLGRAQDLLKRQEPQLGQKDLRGWEWRYLWQQTRSDASFTFCKQSNEIESLAASADGRWLAVGVDHKDGLFVYDLQTRQPVAHLAPGEIMVRAAFSPAQSLLAFAGTVVSVSGQEQSSLHLWNAGTRQMVGEVPLDGECVGLAFSQDGRTLATSTESGHITLWRVSDWTKLVSYPATDQINLRAATGFAVTSDLSLAAFNYGSRNSMRVRVIELSDGKELWTNVAPSHCITALAFSPDGKTLATAAGFNESDVCLWDAATGKQIGTLPDHSSWVGSLVFWPDGKKLASASADQTIRVWDLASQKCLDVLRGHRLEVWRLALLPDGETLVSGAKDGTVCFWDTSVTHPHQSRIIIPDKVADWGFEPDSQSVFTLNEQGQVTRWTGTEFQRKESVLDLSTNYISGWDSFSRDGRYLATGSSNGVIRMWDLSRQIKVHQWTNTTGKVLPIQFLADGTKLITWSGNDNVLHEWNLTTGSEIQSWPAPVESYAAAISPDDRLSVSLGFEGGVIFQNLAAEGSLKVNLDILEANDASFSPNGKLFAVASVLGYARVWDTAAWREAATLGGFLNAVDSVAFSLDGKRLATGGANPFDAVKLWDVDSWQDVFTLAGEGSLFHSTAFSPDGNVIGTLGGTLNLWRAPSLEEIAAAEAKEKAEVQQP